MRTVIDRAGRVAVPASLRDALGLRDGLELEIYVRDGSLVIAPIPTHVRLIRRGKLVVAQPAGRLPTLTQDQVRAAHEGSRR